MNKKNAPKSPKMPQMSNDRGYAFVWWNNKRVNLRAKYGTPEAQAAFLQFQVQMLTDPTFSSPRPQEVTVDALCLAYLQYAKEYDPGHYSSIKTAAEILLKHFTGQAVSVLDTRHFLFLQEKFVEHGVSRKYCNALMGFIRAMLKWGVIRKLVPSHVYGEAKMIPALSKGKTRAREKPERKAYQHNRNKHLMIAIHYFYRKTGRR